MHFYPHACLLSLDPLNLSHALLHFHYRYIVFEGEEGQDAGGLLREWYMIISREMFNPMYALFRTSPGDRVTYTINPSSHCNPNHLSYFKFVGRVVAKAVYDNRLLECYFTRSFYKHILGKSVRYLTLKSSKITVLTHTQNNTVQLYIIILTNYVILIAILHDVVTKRLFFS